MRILLTVLNMFWEEQKVKKLISMFALSAVIALPVFADDHKAKVGMITTLSGGGSGLGIDVRDGFLLALKGNNDIEVVIEEHIHLVALADSGINSVADLAGKRVSLDEPGSGTYVDANLILEANGLSSDDVTAEALKGGAAAEALRNGKIDAFFVVAGYPTGSLVELASAADIKLVPIDGAGASALTDKYGFFASSDIPAGTYEGVTKTSTVSVGAQWFTSASEDEELIYNITKALWNKESRKLLDVGHAKGKTITPDTALAGVGVPLHAGAERFYREVGLVK
ncbi:TAXI family TRAP transporter solute-binding subunit [Amylibacter sp.]|nr:TAXI family TRAP transporter solute-binding subunit [Amylibacter sp.]